MKFNLVGSVAGLLLGTVVTFSSSDLQAGWGVLHGGGSSGGGSYGSSPVGASSGGYAVGASSGGYAAAYSSVGGSSGGSSGGPGLLQRMSSRIHDHMAAKHARHAARRAAYGSSGSYASSGGSTGYYGYASSGGGSSGGYATGYSAYSGGSSGGVSYGSTGYSSGVNYGSTGTSMGYGSTGTSMGYGSTGSSFYGASTESGFGAASMVSNVEASGDAVYLTVAVPADAKVFVNGNATSSTGAVRKFVSHGLKSGKDYKFQVRAEMTGSDGQVLSDEKTLVVSAGAQEQVQFAFENSQSTVETAVTLNLPEGAKVLLAGNETKATGLTRTFRTSRLKPGQQWDDYEIEVEYEGQVKRQNVRLIGGDRLQLTFDFASSTDVIAAR